MATIDERQTEALDRDGAVPLRGIVNAEEQRRIAAAIRDDMENPGPFFHGYRSEEGRFHGNLRLWESHPALRDICTTSALPGIAQVLLRSRKVNLLYDQLFVKDARMTQRTRWHNDQPYWPVKGRQVLSIWIALDETTAESGRLEFIKGSHKWDRWFQPEVFGKTSQLQQYERNPDYEEIPDIEANRDDYDIISWDLAPGDAYAFFGMTVHGAGGNSGETRSRRGYTVRYTGDDVRYDLRVGVAKPLVTDELSNGDVLDSPRYPIVAER